MKKKKKRNTKISKVIFFHCHISERFQNQYDMLLYIQSRADVNYAYSYYDDSTVRCVLNAYYYSQSPLQTFDDVLAQYVETINYLRRRKSNKAEKMIEHANVCDLQMRLRTHCWQDNDCRLQRTNHFQFS